MNYFSPKETAKRYASGRPYYHKKAIKRIAKKLQITTKNKLEKALDIACGTGLSTRALSLISKAVYGSDISEEMLKYTQEKEGVEYIQCDALKQPFEDDFFDLITIASGVHWLDIDAFLVECKRLLKENAYLIIYDNYFKFELIDNSQFKNIFAEKYLNKFPSPPRNNRYEWTNENINSKGFEIVFEERFDIPIQLQKEALINYFTTQSNITAVVSNEQLDYDYIDKWLNKNLTPYFKNNNVQTFNYGTWIKYLKLI